MKLHTNLLGAAICLSAALVFSCTPKELDAVQEPEETISEAEQFDEDLPPHIMGQVLVEFSDEMIDLIEGDLTKGSLTTKSSELNSAIEALGIESMERFIPYDAKWEERHRKFNLHRAYVVKFSKTRSVTKAIDNLAELPGIIEANLIPEIKLAGTRSTFFNDSYFYQQWGMYNYGVRSTMTEGADINVLPVWQNYTTGSDQVQVAIVDGGIDTTHPDLKGNYVDGKNFVTTTSAVTGHGHGCHVASIVSATNNNSVGVVGVAGGNSKKNIKGVGLISCQIFEHTGRTDANGDDIDNSTNGGGFQAMVWACDNFPKCVIAQNSWGFSYTSETQARYASLSSTYKNCIDYFIANAGMDANGNQVGKMKGGVVFFSAGNSAYRYDPIGQYDPVIAVGAMAPDYKRTDYSNYGSWVDICAPGGSAAHDDAYEFIIGAYPVSKGSYIYMCGTSQACPHVSGVAALLVSYFGGPGFTNEMLKEKLFGGANSTVTAGQQIGPLVDAYASFLYGGSLPVPPAKVTDLTATSTRSTITASFSVTADEDDGKAKGYKVLLASTQSALTSIGDFNSIPSSVTVQELTVGNKNVGEKLSATFTGLNAGRTYYIAAVGYDNGGMYSELSNVIAVNTVANTPPAKVEEFVVGPDLNSITVKFNVTADEEDGKAKGYKVLMARSRTALSSLNNFNSIPSTVTANEVLTGSKNVGEELTTVFEGLTEGSTYYIAIVGYDSEGLYSALSPIVEAQTSRNMPPEKVTTLTVTAKSNSLTASFKVTADAESEKADGYIVLGAKNRDALNGLNYANIPVTVKNQDVKVGELSVGSTLETTFTDLEFSQLYYVAVVGYDVQGNYSELSNVVAVSTQQNNPPTVSFDKTSVSIYDFETATVTAMVSEPDDHSYTTGFTPGSSAASFEMDGENTYRITIDGSKARPGTYTATFKATDKYGAMGSASVTYVIKPNTAPEKVTTLAVTPRSNSLKASFNVTADAESGKAEGYLVLLAENRYALNGLDYEALPYNIKSRKVEVGSKGVGEKIEVEFEDLSFDKEYYLAVVGWDVQKLYSDLSDVLTARTQKNNPPVIAFAKEAVSIKAHQSDVVKVTISEPDGHALEQASYTVTPSTDCIGIEDNGHGEYTITVTGRNAQQRKTEGQVTFTVSDEYGATASAALPFTIAKNNAPVNSETIPNVILHDRSESTTVDLSKYFTEPDGEQMTFTVEQSDRILYINKSGNNVTFTALDFGLTTVKITALDGFNLKATAEFKILVREEGDAVATSYPNPVVKNLYVCTTDDLEDSRIILRNAAGKTIIDRVEKTSAFDAAEIDMSGCAPGRYTLTVTCKAGTVTKNIVKK